jgi:preprotein translocase subunit SecA
MMVSEAIRDGVDKYITQDFVAANIAEWARVNFDVALDPDDFRGYRRYEDIEPFIKDQARAEAQNTITATLAEFTGESTEDRTAWDTKGLQSWAMSRFHVQLSQNQIRSMDYHELESKLRDSAIEQINKRDCAGIMKYLEPLYAETELANWVREKFVVDINPHDFMASEKGGRGTRKSAEDIVELIESKAREAYARREIEYPVDQVLSAFGPDGQGALENPYAADYVRAWVSAKYGIELPLAHVQSSSVRKLREELIGYQRDWLGNGRIDALADQILAENPTPEALTRALNLKFGLGITPRDLEEQVQPAAGAGETPAGDGDADAKVTKRDFVVRSVRGFLRKELSDLEQAVLIQFLDFSWKEHLYAMDLLRNSIGLQAFAERDPRVLYKKEGYRYFEEMMMGVREKVTDLIFKARLSGPLQQRNAYQITGTSHEDTGGYGVAENIRAVGGGEEMAAQAEGGEAAAVTKTIVREIEKIGRNDPCPCGSGKKYKKCCGAHAA